MEFEIFTDFYNFLSVTRTVSNMYVQVARAQWCANHMQHTCMLKWPGRNGVQITCNTHVRSSGPGAMVCKSRATHMYAQVARAQWCANHVQHTCTLKWPGRNGVQITCNTSSAYHVQPAVCHLVRRDSSATKSDRVEIAFILALFCWLKPWTDEEGEETRVLGENPWWQAPKNATY